MPASRVSTSVATERRRPQRTLKDISELRVLKAAYKYLHQLLVLQPDACILEMPRRPDGSLRIMCASFLKRIINGDFELKVCMEGDVSGAQMDLRHLSLEQLLAIRVLNLDFVSDSSSHSAHRNFLNSVDKNAFEKLARRCLRGCDPSALKVGSLQALGVQIATVLGAMEVLGSGWDARTSGARDPQANRGTELALLPRCWAWALGEAGWDGCCYALFDSTELSLEGMPGECPDFSGRADGRAVAVISDRSRAMGNDRRLHWDIFILDPQTDDIPGAMLADAAGEQQRQHTSELSAAIAKRTSGRLGVLGLEQKHCAQPSDASGESVYSANLEIAKPRSTHSSHGSGGSAYSEALERLKSPSTGSTCSSRGQTSQLSELEQLKEEREEMRSILKRTSAELNQERETSRRCRRRLNAEEQR